MVTVWRFVIRKLVSYFVSLSSCRSNINCMDTEPSLSAPNVAKHSLTNACLRIFQDGRRKSFDRVHKFDLGTARSASHTMSCFQGTANFSLTYTDKTAPRLKHRVLNLANITRDTFGLPSPIECELQM